MEELEIRLRPVEESDLLLLKEWRNDPELMSRVREFKMLSNVNQRKWFATLYDDSFPHNLMFCIECLKESSHITNIGDGDWEIIRNPDTIGCCGLCYVDYINRSAEISLYIGDEKHRNKGFGTMALSELKKKAFDDMNLVRLWTEIYSMNEPFIKLVEKAGYTREATLKNTVYKNGVWRDSHYYTLFKGEL